MNGSIAPNDRPNKDWTLKSLENYALSRAGDINTFARNTLEQTWFLGEVLSLIREIKKEKGGWMKWVEGQPFSLSTAMNSIKVYERSTFDELKKFNGMTSSDMKVALEIIKAPPPSKKSKAVEDKPTPNASEVATVQTTEDAPEKAADRKNTITDYSRNGDQKKTTEPEVGVALTASEVLGKALSLLIAAEQIGITPDCNDIIAKLSEKIVTLAAATIVA